MSIFFPFSAAGEAAALLFELRPLALDVDEDRQPEAPVFLVAAMAALAAAETIGMTNVIEASAPAEDAGGGGGGSAGALFSPAVWEEELSPVRAVFHDLSEEAERLGCGAPGC